MPDDYFFRHVKGISGVKENSKFGEKYFYKYWIKACNELGIEGVDLYGGTRHSTTTALAKKVGEADAKRATGHKTNKAFERYCQFQDDETFEIIKVVSKMRRKICEQKDEEGKND